MKQQSTIKEINIKNRIYYFYNNIIYPKNFDEFEKHLLHGLCDC